MTVAFSADKLKIAWPSWHPRAPLLTMIGAAAAVWLKKNGKPYWEERRRERKTGAG
jgi:hypothetical protein